MPRTTQEEKDFGDFDIFDDPERPYSTFNFRYEHVAFSRLARLAEFNTLLHVDDVKREIRNCIRSRRRHSIRRPCKVGEPRPSVSVVACFSVCLFVWCVLNSNKVQLN